VELFRLFGSIFIENDAANKSIDATDAKARQTEGSLFKTIGTAAKWGAGILAGATAAVGGVIALANKTAAVADEIDKLSERTGIGRERLQELKYAANQSGVEFTVLEKAVKTMSTSAVSAAAGGKTAAAAYKQLGISLKDNQGNLKDTNRLFEESMAALADMEQGVQRNALGNQIFGRGFTEMLPLLNAGSEGIKALTDRSRELGLVMSEDAIKANVVFGDTLQDVKDSAGAIFNGIMTTVLPALQSFIDLILQHMPQIQAVLQAVFGFIGTLVGGFVQGIQLIVGWVQTWATSNSETLGRIKATFAGIFADVRALITGFVEFATGFWKLFGDDIMSVVTFVWDNVVNAFETATKLISDVLKIFSALFRGDWEGLWNGVKSFFSDIWAGIVGGLKATINLIIRAVNGMINGLNRLQFNVPSWVPLLGGKSWGFSIPNIPELEKGGDIMRSGMTLVGEKGPEELYLPQGAQVRPLSAGSAPAMVFERGAFEGVIVMDDYGTDRLMDRVFERAAQKGLKVVPV
jgi:hypothetical protein